MFQPEPPPPHDVVMQCLFCSASIFEADLETHLRTDHRMGHDRAVEMLIAMQYSEGGSLIEQQPEILTEQVPVNEQCQVTEEEPIRDIASSVLEPNPDSFTENDSPLIITDSPPEIEMIDEILCSPAHQVENTSFQPLPLTKTEDFHESSLVSLSVFGVRFRCPICEYLDVNVRFVRDHMKQCHKGKKDKEQGPRRQEMKVRIKPPRIYKDTMMQSLAYYKSFGGQFFKTGVHAEVKFVRDPILYIRNLKDPYGPNEDRPCPKRFKRKNSNKSEDRPSAPTTPVPDTDQPAPNNWEIVTQVYDEVMPNSSLKRKNKEEPNVEKKKKKIAPKQGIPKVKLIRRGSTGSTNSSTEQISQENSESSESSDFSIETKLSDTDEKGNMSTIDSFLTQAENDNVTDFMENMTSLLSEETEINFDSIIEDQTIADLSQSISEEILGDLSMENNDMAKDSDDYKKFTDDKNVAKESFMRDAAADANGVIPKVPSKRQEKDATVAKPQKKKGSKSKNLKKNKTNTESDQKRENTTQEANKELVSAQISEKSKEDIDISQRKSKSDGKGRKGKRRKDPKCDVPKMIDDSKSDNQEKIANILSENDKLKNMISKTAAVISEDFKSNFESKDYQKYVNNVNKTLKDFTWSKRVYSLKVANVINENKKYQKILMETIKHYREKSKELSSEENKSLIESTTPVQTTPNTDSEKMLKPRPSRNGRRGNIREGEALHKLLSYLLGLLMKKDSNKWFSVPIDDKMAPGYSEIIKEKMDFTKMENKLDAHSYCTLGQFKYDFQLIYQNCMKFNKPESSYHKAAKKLEGFGKQILSKNNIRDIVLDRPIYSNLTPNEIGFDVFDMADTDEEIPTEDINVSQKQSSLLFGNEIEDLFISAAERVKFGRRRGQPNESEKNDENTTPRRKGLSGKRASALSRSSSETSQEDSENIKTATPMEVIKGGRRKRQSSVENIDLTPKRKSSVDNKANAEKSSRKSSKEKVKEVKYSSNSKTPTTSLVHHDYFGGSNTESNEEDTPSRPKTVDKIKSLYKVKPDGTYVQCCVEKCKKWRFLTEYEDPSQVPEYWECSMNQDTSANKCSLGDGSDPEDEDVEFVNVNFTCGSLVWAKVKGFPWWPAIIDYCPDSEEYYWIEENESKVEPAWYHVVFLEESVSRSWVRAENLQKLTTPIQQPTGSGSSMKSSSMKSRFKKALVKVNDCMNISLKERLQKYSFASLFKGKWGEYSDISSDEEDGEDTKTTQTPKKSKERSSSQDMQTPVKDGINSLDTFECEKCTEKLIYTKYPVVKHLKKHKLDLRGYCLKFDPEEKNEKLGLIREWIDREEFRKAIAEDPWKPKRTGKSSEKKTIEEVVNEPSPKLSQSKHFYMTERESEEFHINSAVISNPVKYEKPQLSTESLIAVAVRNLDPRNKNGASFWQIVAFISLHFPYYDANYETCVRLVKKGYGQNPDDEKEPTGSFRIKPAVVQRLYSQISPVLTNEKEEIEKSMLHPKFLDLMVEKFLGGEDFKHPKEQYRPPYTNKQLTFIALIVLKKPSNLEQIIIYLLFLFPGFSEIQDSFRKNFMDDISQLREIEHIEQGRDRRFNLVPNACSKVLKDLRNFTSSKENFEELKLSIFHEDFINVLFPGLEVIEDEKEDLNNHDVSTTEEDESCSKFNSLDKCPLPNEIIVFFVFTFQSKLESHGKLTLQEVQNSISELFLIRKKELGFVKQILKSEVYLQLPDNKFEINPLAKNFCIAALMKFVIDNLEDLLEYMPEKNCIEVILPRMCHGSDQLRSDFLYQTIEFSKKKCVHWKPPIDEKLIYGFAILSTADINDCASKSSILDFVYENFPWYRLTKQHFGITIPEKKIYEADSDANFALTSVETILVRQQLKVFVTSNIVALRSLMPRLEVFNIFVDAQILQQDSNKYSKPPFPESVMVIISLIHISDDYGWCSAFKIQKFVETNFPFYQLEMATEFLAKISSWNEKSIDGQFFNIKNESMMCTFQIKPEKFFLAYAWVSKFIKFEENEISPQYKFYMKSPQLIRDILSLPPPSWKNFYAPQKQPPVADETAPPPQTVKGNTNGLVTINKNLFHTEESAPQVNQVEISEHAVVPQTTEWEKPLMETPVKIALAMILWDIKCYHEEEGFNEENDVAFTMLSFHQRHSMSDIVKIVREVFPYYESKEHTKEFVVVDIQQNKKLFGEYFDLIKNEDGKQEYQMKLEYLGHIYEEIINLMDWKTSQHYQNLLRNPDLASSVLDTKSRLSEASILALILFQNGNFQTSYSNSLDFVLKKWMDKFDVHFLGFSGKRWSIQKLEDSIRKIISSLVEFDTDFWMEKNGNAINIGLKTEEGRIDEIFANLQKSCCTVMKSEKNPHILEMITKFMEMPTATSSSNYEPEVQTDIPTCPPEPPFPRNYLIGLALKNLTPTPGSPVLMTNVWKYLCTTFPYFTTKESWCMAELEVGMGFNRDTEFVYQVVGEDFTIALTPQHTEVLLREVAEFSKIHVAEIQKSMRSFS